jgi:two-component system chemotaxis response regulator CheB
MSKPIQVLCVDDSAFVRKILSDELNRHADIEVVACANDPLEARDILVSRQVDVMILDIEMPRMDGITFLEQLMAKRPMPVVMFSSLTQAGADMAVRALSLGAVDVVGKPTSIAAMRELGAGLAEKVRVASRAGIGRLKKSLTRPVAASPSVSKTPLGAKPSMGLKTPMAPKTGGGLYKRQLLLLGASTGGTEALRSVFAQLPADTPGTLVVQHMPSHFTASFAKSLDQTSAMTVREAKDGDLVRPGVALIAPGGSHMVVEGTGSGIMKVRIQGGPPVCHQKPAVDVLFNSAVQHLGGRAVAAILTGMGHDGTDGLLALRKAGCRTVGQDEESCVVYGMPKAANEAGAVEKIVSLDNIPATLLELLAQK